MKRNTAFVLLGLLLTLLLAGGVSYYASSQPDGLEKISATKGIDEQARDHDAADSPLADYGVKGVDDARLSVGVAGVLGVLVTFAFGGAVVLAVRRRDGKSARTG